MKYDSRLHLLLGFVLGMLATFAIRDLAAVDAGDWLTFIGVIVAIAGSIFSGQLIEHRKQRMDYIRSFKRLSGAIQLVIKCRNYVPLPIPPATSLTFSDALGRRYSSLRDAINALVYALDRITIDDFELWELLNYVRNCMSRMIPIMDQYEPLIFADKLDPSKAFAGNRQLDAILALLDTALPRIQFLIKRQLR